MAERDMGEKDPKDMEVKDTVGATRAREKEKAERQACMNWTS